MVNLAETDIDIGGQAAFDGLVDLTSQIFDAPMAALLACRDGSKRAEALLGPSETIERIYDDLSLKSREENEPFVFRKFSDHEIGLPEGGEIRFLCGLKLCTSDGSTSVTLIVADSEPRPGGITPQQERSLEILCSQAVSQIELRQSQAIQRASSSRLAFLGRLAEATQNLTDATGIMQRTAHLIGEHLDLEICAYADMDADEDGFTIGGNWVAPGAQSIVGSYQLSRFGELAVTNLKGGKPLVIDDTATLPPGAEQMFASIGVRATICMPLIKEGRLTALMAVHSARPRKWTKSELHLIGEVVERSWAHIERVRSERTARETTRRLNAILGNTRSAVFLMDESQQCIYANAAAEQLTGYAFAEMRGRPLHDVVHHKKPDGSHYPIEECPIDRAFPERAQMSGEELFVAPDGEFYPVGFTASPVLDDQKQPIGTVIEARNITEERRAREHQDLLIDELNHRAKNLLAIVQGIVAQTMKSSDPAIRHALEGRLMALAAAHSLLTKRNWEPAPLQQIVADALEPHVQQHVFHISGPHLMLASKTAVSMLLALHELATNAVKYGSLSVPEGKIDVTWHTDEGMLHFTWRESGGPKVVVPQSRGFGSRMLERGLAAELDGQVRIDFAPDGLVCAITAPLDAATA